MSWKISVAKPSARLLKNELKPWLKDCWGIPPEANAEFVACMEDILTVYRRPRDQARPLVCLDEFSKQLLEETRPSIKAAKGRVKKQDSEYVRYGSAIAFMMYAPLEGHREVFISEDGRRTADDYAHVLEYLADELYPDAEKIALVEDNLNTHGDASLYKAFPQKKAMATETLSSTTPKTKKPVYTVAEIASLIGRHKSWTYRLIYAHRIKVIHQFNLDVLLVEFFRDFRCTNLQILSSGQGNDLRHRV